jgi:hypothetical protein
MAERRPAGRRWDRVVGSDAFARLYELLPRSAFKTRVGHELLRDFDSGAPVATALAVAKALHDSQTRFSFPDEQRQVAKDLAALVGKLQADSPDAQLQLLAACRAGFPHAVAVPSLALQRALALAQTSPDRVELVAACLAFCMCTAPSIPDASRRGFALARSGLAAAGLGRGGHVRVFFCAAADCLREEAPGGVAPASIALLAYICSAALVAGPAASCVAERLAEVFATWVAAGSSGALVDKARGLLLALSRGLEAGAPRAALCKALEAGRGATSPREREVPEY